MMIVNCWILDRIRNFEAGQFGIFCKHFFCLLSSIDMFNSDSDDDGRGDEKKYDMNIKKTREKK